MASKRTSLIAVGFNVFLEHQLSYCEKSEKGEIHDEPIVQLGGGAFNFIKSLHALGVSTKSLTLEMLASEKPTAHSVALDFLLKQEPFTTHTIPILGRPYSSYYLLSPTENMFAFGDRKMKVRKPSPQVLKNIERVGKQAQIKIATEVLADPTSLALARALLKRTGEQESVLVPSKVLLSTKKLKTLFPHVTVLSMNREEAHLFWGTMFGEKELMSCPVPTILVTDGPDEAILKFGDAIYRASPARIENPKYPGGAGDTATAALVYELFVCGTKPDVALRKALAAGTKVLTKPTPYL